MSELRRDGVLVVSEEWSRRARVRELFGLFAEHRRVLRTVAASTLWPDLDAQKAEANLRVTLTYLIKVLESDRRRAEAPFFVRTDGGLLVLDSSVETVIEEFDR